MHTEYITFLSRAPGLAAEDFVVLEMDGLEEIGRPYAFEIVVVTQRADLDTGAILLHPATLGLKQATTTASGAAGLVTETRTGLLASFEETGRQNEWYRYRAVLVSPLWRLSQNFQSRIFLGKDVRAILEEVLASSELTANDYKILPEGRTYPARPYVVQYQETDLDFVQRWLEHEGVFHWTEQVTEDRAIVKFGDSPAHHTDLKHAAPYVQKPGASGDSNASFDWTDAGSVDSWTCRRTRVPRTVVLRDYNWRTPSASLEVTQEVSAGGLGIRYETGNHYATLEEGRVLGRIRAEEILCREQEFLGEGTSRRFCAGGVFDLTQHYRAEWNARYLLERVRHVGSQDVALATRAVRRSSYRNEFVAVRFDPKVPYRPPRRTPWPSVKGVMSARVDGPGDPDSRNLDDDGHYRVRLPLDRSDRSGGEASCAVRMAQPSAGPTSKMHFPLHKGAEVLLAHEDGNPDRPVIAAAVPDGESRSPVVKTNQTDNVISTTKESLIVLADDETSPKLILKSGRNSQITLSNLFGTPLDTLSTQSWMHSENAMLNHSVYAGLLAGTTAGGSVSWFAGWPKLQMAVRLALAEAQKAMAEEIRRKETTGHLNTALTIGDAILSGASSLVPLLMNLAFLKRWAKNDAKAKLKDVKGHFSGIQGANEAVRKAWYKRLSGWLVGKGDSLMDLVGMSMTGGLAQRILGGKDAALKARQSRPAFYLFRGGGVLGQGGCTAMAANGNGENFLFSTAEGSIDFGAGMDIFAHADGDFSAFGEKGVRVATRWGALSMVGTDDTGCVSLETGGSSLFLEDALGMACLARTNEAKKKSSSLQLFDNGLYAKSSKICLDVAMNDDSKGKPKIILEDKKISVQTEEPGTITIRSPEFAITVSETGINFWAKDNKGSIKFVKGGNVKVAGQGILLLEGKDVTIKGNVKLDGDVEVTGKFKHGNVEAQPMAPPPSTPPQVESGHPEPLGSETEKAQSDWHSEFQRILKFWKDKEGSE